ncbi:PEPxxWA-CTERM sorting domain-containing protein [Sphingomonas sp. JC676]|uniref:PEPxxWA-CTERM sorting domain-containing protein n=1 Tax=Sphingomonas sp. JC676 TaxID=2768065 RepID=UPI0016586ED5|nr:PEPxxWA-CTERM sorting domain-containing protein [Sphingomonas sp. JC676]MBC9033649.1 PEPxxWA-CTERM sorting domain-containing protein [Sphingomonas sp. JC676]
MVATITKLACAAVFTFSAFSAHAQEVLTNGNFESGLTGWTSYATPNGTIAELPSLPGAPASQSASVVSFNVTGSGASNALFLNAGKINGPYNSNPGEGGGVFQMFTTTTDGLASFSADVAALYTRTSGASGLGLMSVLLDGVVMDTYDFGGVNSGPATLRGVLGFTTNLAAGQHTITLQATRLFAPARGVASQYFDNVSLVVTPVPEPVSWAMMVGGFGLAGAAMRRRRSTKVSFA